MPRTLSLPDWSDEDVFIIGGGSSLRTFDWSCLRGQNTIGCNQAFLLGPGICNICVFGDLPFWGKFFKELANFRGWVATSETVCDPPPWLFQFQRKEGVLCQGKTLGWFFNTGALAVNLALVLGASRVFLLGFDMKVGLDKSHWHDHAMEVPVPENYDRFLEQFTMLMGQLPQIFPGKQVLNVTDGSSMLRCVPSIQLHEVL